jgi:hypothetical protein
LQYNQQRADDSQWNDIHTKEHHHPRPVLPAARRAGQPEDQITEISERAEGRVRHAKPPPHAFGNG